MTLTAAVTAKTESDPISAPTADAFRIALRGAVGQVSVITLALPDGEWSGMTLTSASALSTQPPMLIACVNRNASAHVGLHIGALLGWQVLGAAQTEVAAAFAGQDGRRGAARFVGAQWEDMHGARLLIGAPMACAAQVTDLADHASHTVVIARILSLRQETGRGTLAYRDGAYLPLP